MAHPSRSTKLIALRPAEVKLGMFLHSFEGHWADRPFWHTGFVISDIDDLNKLRASHIDAVLIDVANSQASVGSASVLSVKGPSTRESAMSRTDPGCRAALQAIARSKREIVRLHADVRLGRPLVVARLVPVVAELSAELERSNSGLMSLLRMKAPDDYTHLHSVAVCALMLNAATTLRINVRERLEYGIAGLLHDVGKATVPVAILSKRGALTDEEAAIVRGHAEGGERLLRSAKDVPPIAIDVCLHHHERIDGTGYPHRLDGRRLSVAAKMGAICDVYDAMTSHRCYRNAVSPQLALREMEGRVGAFDPGLFSAFMDSVGIFPVETLVRVRETSLGVVVADNHIEPTRPTVRTFFSIAGRHRMVPEDFVVGRANVLSVERPEDWGFHDWQATLGELLSASTDKAA